jgi:hypothetical protein
MDPDAAGLSLILIKRSFFKQNFSGHQFDVAGAILASLKNLKVDLAVDSGVKLDDCKGLIISVMQSLTMLQSLLISALTKRAYQPS